MPKLITHKFVSTIPDGDDTGLVRPSNWNDTHDVSGVAESGANSDITSMTGVTGGISTPDYIQYDTTATPTIALGKERWNVDTGTLAFGIIDGTQEVQIGQQMYAQVYNAESVTITKGQAVYLYQATGNKASVKLAYNTGDATSAKTLGLAAQDIVAGGTGFITTQGVLDKLNTGSYNEGDTLYLGATAGSLTATKPSAPNHLVYIGVVERANNGNGQIYVRVQNGYELDEIHDVQINSPTTGQTLVYNQSTQLWNNSNAPTIIGGSINNTPIGATTPSTGKFTTLEATGTSTLGTGSSQYLQAAGGSTEAQLSAQGAGTNIPLVLQPKGTGAIQAQATTSTTAGGNARGANAVDWQTARVSAGQVASGQYCFIGAGQSNTASQFATAVVGGRNNNVGQTNYGFIGGGNANTLSTSVQSNYASIVGGAFNTAAGNYNFIGGGFTNSGTSGSAVTTQATTTVTSGSTAVTLSGSNANIKVGQYITGTSIASDTYVAAISGTSLTLSQNATASGTPTLSFFTPHGVVVGGGNNQATGSYSFIGGGGDAGTSANRNVASGDWSFVGGGRGNIASGAASTVGGGGFDGTSVIGNTASGIGATVIGGAQNLASGLYATTSGRNNLADGNRSAVFGNAGSSRSIRGNFVTSACQDPISSNVGSSQAALLILGKQTTDATATVIASNSGAASTDNQVILPNNSAYYFKIEVIAGKTAAGDSKAWELKGAIKRGANAGTTTLIGTVTSTVIGEDAGASAWTAVATADTTNGGIKLTVTGQASTTIRWVARCTTVEMTY